MTHENVFTSWLEWKSEPAESAKVEGQYQTMCFTKLARVKRSGQALPSSHCLSFQNVLSAVGSFGTGEKHRKAQGHQPLHLREHPTCRQDPSPYPYHMQMHHLSTNYIHRLKCINLVYTSIPSWSTIIPIIPSFIHQCGISVCIQNVHRFSQILQRNPSGLLIACCLRSSRVTVGFAISKCRNWGKTWQNNAKHIGKTWWDSAIST